MNVTLIHNANAGDSDLTTPDQLVALIEEAGHTVRHQSIKSDGWQNSLDQPADLVAVAGGDGSVGEVVRRMVGRRTPVAVVPSGTANNIAKSLGIADWDAAQLIGGWSRAVRMNFDAGVALGPWGRRHFVEGVGMGLFTEAMPWITHRQCILQPPSAGDRIADALHQLREHLHGTKASPLNVILDGRDISDNYIMLEAMNTHYVGPNLFLAPDVEHGDGLLHVVGVTEGDRELLDACLGDWKFGSTWPADLGVHTGKRLEIEWTGFPVHIDDLPWQAEGDAPAGSRDSIILTIERAALQFLVPDREQLERAEDRQ